MQIIIDFFKNDLMILVMPIILLLMIVLYIVNLVKLSKMQKNYNNFMKKLGHGKNIEENLKEYLNKVEKVEDKNRELENYIEQVSKDMKKCIQKVGIVRYSAFKDVGSDLSFTLALLDEENNGVVLNGIYSTDMSNIYAKPIKNGESTYTLSEQEKEAIDKAIKIEY